MDKDGDQTAECPPVVAREAVAERQAQHASLCRVGAFMKLAT